MPTVVPPVVLLEPNKNMPSLGVVKVPTEEGLLMAAPPVILLEPNKNMFSWPCAAATLPSRLRAASFALPVKLVASYVVRTRKSTELTGIIGKVGNVRDGWEQNEA